jgi:hypothetical protein
VHWGIRKALMAWMTVLIYALSACAFIIPGHCCSQHSHGEGEADGDHDHMIAESAPDGLALSDLTSLLNEPSVSRHCCGQGLHGAADRIALHAASSQSSTEPSRVVRWLSPSAEADHRRPEILNLHSLSMCALSRPSARSPALESILTVSLLI